MSDARPQALNVQISHDPSYAMATVVLRQGVTVVAEAGAMVMMSDGVKVSASLPGGVTRALGRKLLSQESFFQTKFTGLIDGAWVALSPPLPGDINVVTLPPAGLIIQSGSYLASAASVQLRTDFAGLSRIVGREGAFVIHAEGEGQLMLSAYGGVQRIELAAGQRLVIDTGHYVASSADMAYEIGMLEGIVTSALSGEGLVASLTGPGIVFVQTRSPKELRSWLAPERPQNA